MHATEAAGSGAASRPRARISAYDLPSEEKLGVGARLREVREIAGVPLHAAASALGYSQAVQLSLMESGQRPVTLRVLEHYAVAFGTTADFLLGLAPDSDRDPVAGLHREVAGRVATDVRRLIECVVNGAATVVRELRPEAGLSTRMASQIVEAAAALRRLREMNPEADEELRGLATLVARLDAAVGSAQQQLASVVRGHRRAQGRAVDFTAHAEMGVGDLVALAAKLGPLPDAALPQTDDDDTADDLVDQPQPEDAPCRRA